MDDIEILLDAGAGTLKLLLSFAVGGLLGDVFLHLLPEAWSNNSLNINSTKEHPSMLCGLWVLTGFLLFIITEKIFIGTDERNDEDDEDDHDDADDNDDNINNVKTEMKINADEMYANNNRGKETENNNLLISGKMNGQIRKLEGNMELNYCNKNGYLINSNSTNVRKNGLIELNNCNEVNTNGEMQRIQSSNSQELFNKNTNEGLMKNVNNGTDILHSNGKIHKNLKVVKRETKVKSKHISGYLNLLANCIDNFTHGLAVGGSFLVSFRLGALTTLAILIHEIPHEVGDFAILLKSGFNRWDAARAQLITSSGGIFGALLAVLCSGSGVETRTSWILPFTAGGFLHIGLVTILPELQRESNPKESMKQLGALLSGITIMAILTAISD
ncbi:hypothetical protein PV327_000400 [Microctonus hyperodae]|uniref:Zinc transporter ZIP13 n=1 Tax=Microctonus hyperodae TaxID=165561 RepID=A0AA39G667_MICHY|nr:hypothetical protein PV327_000400 [Microctonus hyperodae]